MTFIPPAAPAAYGQVPPFMPQPVPQGYPAQPPQGYQPPPAFAPTQPAMNPLQAALAGMRSAPAPTTYGAGFDNPKGTPWTPGQPGIFDGRYRVRLVRAAYDSREKGLVFRWELLVLESSNPNVKAGEHREIACFMWHAPSKSEAQGYTQACFEAMGGQGAYTDEFSGALFDARNPCAGLELTLTVETRPKGNKPLEPFAKKALFPIRAEQPAAPPQPAPTAQPQAQGWPAGVPMPPGMPAGMPAPFVPGAA